MKLSPTLKRFSAIVGLAFAVAPAAAQITVYEDDFDNDTLVTNAGIGGGLIQVTSGAGAWLDNGNLDSNKTANNARGEATSFSSFNLKDGFQLTVSYTIDDVANSGGSNRVQFGFIDSASLPSDYFTAPARQNDFLNRDSIMEYGLGLNLGTNNESQGFNFNDGAGTLTSLSNTQSITAGSHTAVIEINSGGNWSYSIDGAVATVGTTTFDLDRNYHFTTFVQDNTSNFKIELVTLISPPPADDDLTSPAPDPMTWESPPMGISEDEITMTANTATDTENAVEYYFTNETVFAVDGDTAHDSGWQTSPEYTDSGLTPGASYDYTVKARDTSSNLNETSKSAPLASASTDPEDTTPPDPSPLTWASAPAAISANAITMTATTATDPKGVEYYFSNLNDPSHDSGWQNSETYTDAGLRPSTLYGYTVKARDKSLGRNETEPQPFVNLATTDPYTGDILFADSFDRPDSSISNGTALTESFAGMSGALGGLTWAGMVTPAGTVLDINDTTMRVDLFGTDGNLGGVAYISDHNFVDNAIKSAGAFTVSVDINAASSAGDGRIPGFGVGQSLADLTGMTGARPETGSADFYVGYDKFGATQGIVVYHGTNQIGYTAFPASHAGTPTTMATSFWFDDMNAGSTLNYQVYLDGETVVTGSTTWSDTDENYISLHSNTTEDTLFDNFSVRAVSLFIDDYTAWASNYPTADLSDPASDNDNDGVINDDERLFGLDPTDPSSLDPFTVPFNSAEGTFSFTRRSDNLTGLVSTIEVSTDLVMWSADAGAILTPGLPDGMDIETVEVALSDALLSNPKLFLRVSQGNPPMPAIQNGSFEDPTVGDGELEALGTPWTVYDPDDVATSAAGEVVTYNPSSDYAGVAPDGENVANTFFTSTIPNTAFGCSQILGESFAANTNYTVKVEVGRGTAFNWPGYRVELWAGSTKLAEDNNTLSPIAGSFETSTVSYTYDAGDTGLAGQALEIRLLNLGQDPELIGTGSFTVDFDNVTFSPESSSP